MPRKTWREKLENTKGLPRIVKLGPKMARRWGGTRCAIPSPKEVQDLMRQVPKGKLTTISEIRKAIAKRHRTEIACPLTCGIFVWIIANAANEDRENGKRRITPYWRTLKAGGYLNPRYPGGVGSQRKLLEGEGHTIEKKGKQFKVKDYERRLISF